MAREKKSVLITPVLIKPVLKNSGLKKSVPKAAPQEQVLKKSAAEKRVLS